MFKMFGFSHGNFFLSISNVVTLIEKMCNFFVIPASTNTVSNSANYWYVSKYELTRSSNPRMDSVTLIVHYYLIRQTKTEMSFVGKLHQICLYFFIIMQIKDFTSLLGCCKPPSYVPYKGTYVPYDGTFGAPDQGQMLDV